MKKKLHKFGFFLCLLALICSSASPVMAAKIDSAQMGAITIEIRDPDTGRLYPEQAEVRLYRVAALSAENGIQRFVATSSFSSVGIDYMTLNAAGELDAATRLAAHITANSLPAYHTASGNTGKFSLGQLDLGIYLVRYTSWRKELTISPFLVTLPMRDAATSEWSYTVTVYPKYSETKPPSPESSRPSGSSSRPPNHSIPSSGPPLDTLYPNEVPAGTPKLPQTGTLRWPILLLGLVGIVLFAAGWADLYLKRE